MPLHSLKIFNECLRGVLVNSPFCFTFAFRTRTNDMKNILLLLILMLSAAGGLKAQFTVSAEYRVRPELNNGLVTLPTESSEASLFVSQRTRLNFKYVEEKFTTYISFQDVRLWGGEDNFTRTGISFNSVGVDISEAWFDWKFSKNWGLRAGRQIWAYDAGRILWHRNWNQTALSYDAFLLHYDTDKLRFHVGSSINNTFISFNPDLFIPQGSPYEEPLGYRIKYFNFIWLNFKLSKDLIVSINNYLSSYQADTERPFIYSMATHGLYSEFKPNNWHFQGEFYYQYGRNGRADDVSAYMGSIIAMYKMGKLKIGGGLDYLSGDKETEKYNAFDLLYGARFKVNGRMNYYNLAASTNHLGLVDIYPRLIWSPSEKHQVYATYHFFSLAQDIGTTQGTPSTNYNKNIGGELDISYTYKFDRSFNISAYFGYYFATETTEYLKNIPKGESTSPYWASIMFTFKPVLFRSDKK
jgi:hypothetical protein